MFDRRTMIAGLLTAIAGPVATNSARAEGAMSRIAAYAFSVPALSGDDIRLAEFTGRPLLVVNTASLCGYTPQYAGLQELWTEFGERGLAMVGAPTISADKSRAAQPKLRQRRGINTALPY
jgi:glutathione peroxidase